MNSSGEYFAPRKVVKVEKNSLSVFDQERRELPGALSEYRNVQALILLGEPGAGKTEAFRHEARAVGGVLVRIAEFIDTDIDREWEGKILFLDGLDEIRASGNATSILQKVVNQLKKMGKPQFRIACRAADWNTVDQLDLEPVSLGKPIEVLRLLELDEEDVVEILRINFSSIDAESFIAEAKRHGIFALMKNPQTLALFTYAFDDGVFPDFRRDVFEIACEKQLQEENSRHRANNKNNEVSIDKLMDAAGHVFALVLLSDSLGITSRYDLSNKQFLQINKIEDVDQTHIAKIRDSRLFIIHSDECWVPGHRTIAEFLAAKWLAKQLDGNKLSKRRLFNLMLGGDGGVISSLRGIYAWLVVLSNSARDDLIAKDPLGVIFYADPKILSVNAKIQLLDALKAEASRFPNFYWRLQDYTPLGGLADSALCGYFGGILQEQDYTAEHQVLICCILDVLKYGDFLTDLTDAVYSLVLNANFFPHVRASALIVWFRFLSNRKEAIDLLNKIKAKQLKDDNDELAGFLLSELYPSMIKPESLIQYLHKPKRDHFTGAYIMFWCYELARVVPEKHIPILLDDLVGLDDLRDTHHVHYRMSSMVDRILEQGIRLYGESVSAERLFSWLGIGQDEYGSVYHENETWSFLTQWFSARPLIYQQVLGVVFEYSEMANKPADVYYNLSRRLSGLAVSGDIAMWHFQQLDKSSHEELMNIHLWGCLDTLFYRHDTTNLSLEMLEAWAKNNETKALLLNKFLVSPLDDWRSKQAQDNLNRQARIIGEKQARTRLVTPYLASLSSVTAPVGLLNQLAHLWGDHFYNVSGDTIEQRFNNYSENGIEVLEEAKIGFRKCIEREDLPTVDDIISTHLKGREYLIGYPCLLGLELRWSYDKDSILSLADPLLEIATAFFLVGIGQLSGGWLESLVKHKPALIAKVYLQYFSAVIKAKKNDPRLVYELTTNSDFSSLAFLVVINALKIFPLRAKNEQMRVLRRFIYWAYENNSESFNEVVSNKFSLLNSMADSQKVYWLFCANLSGELITDEDFWLFIGSSQAKLGHLTSFLESKVFNQNISARFLGRLIEKVSRLASIEYSGKGHVSVAEQLGDQLRGWVNQLASIPTEAAAYELDVLIQNPKLQKIHALLKTNLYEHEIKKREARFSFADFHQVQEVLACKQPANIADLHALVLDKIDEFSKKLRTSYVNFYKNFWKDTSSSKHINQKTENDCRDALLALLQGVLQQIGIDDGSEAQYFNNKRADIRLAYGANMALPIEIKRDSNDELWTGCKTQLIDKYAIDPKAQGYGIYLVLWFGSGNVSTKNMIDGGRRPQSASELEQRLIAQLDERYKSTIAIKVLDVSLPM